METPVPGTTSRLVPTLHVLRVAVGLVFLCLLWYTARADVDESNDLPNSELGATTLTAEQLVDHLRATPKLLLIDSRVNSSRKKGYIEGSQHLPDIQTSCTSLAQISSDKSAPIGFYCGSNRCGRSLNAVRIARDCGFTNIFWFRGGFEEWKSRGFPYQLDTKS